MSAVVRPPREMLSEQKGSGEGMVPRVPAIATRSPRQCQSGPRGLMSGAGQIQRSLKQVPLEPFSPLRQLLWRAAESELETPGGGDWGEWGPKIY